MLFHNFQGGLAARTLIWPRRRFRCVIATRIRRTRLTTKHHTLTVLLGINSHHGLQRNVNLHGHTPEASTKLQGAITDHKATHGARADIEHDLAIGDML